MNSMSQKLLTEKIIPQKIGNVAQSESQGLNIVQQYGNIDSLYVDEEEANEYKLQKNSMFFDTSQTIDHTEGLEKGMTE